MKYLFILFLAIPFFVFSQSPAHDALDLSDSIPFNSGVTRATLPNGFTYYLARNSVKPGKILVQLNVKAGWLLQEEDTPEVAHVVEHVVLRSSRYYPEAKSLKQYLKKSGIDRYNAHPEVEHIFYYFEIPADTAILGSLCLAFQDWLSGRSSVTKATVSAEKKIVLAEKNERGSVDYTNAASQLLRPSRFSSVYQAITASDVKEKIAALSPASVRQFYNDWYRPNLGGLVVVGDIDIPSIEGIIRKKFSGMQNPVKQRPHSLHPIVLTGDNKYITDLRADAENRVISLELYFMKERRPLATYADYKEAVLIELFNGMLQGRLSDLYKGRPRQALGTVQGDFNNGIYALNALRVRALQFSSRCDHPTSVEPSLRAVFAESERIRRYGFDEQELENTRSELLSSLAAGGVEGLDEEAQRYSDHFIYREAAPAAALRHQVRKKFLEEITLQEINQTVRAWFTAQNRHIVIRAPQGSAQCLPSEATALSWFKEAQQLPLLPYRISKKSEVKVNFDSLYSTPLRALARRQDFEKTNITQLQLANGVDVIIKPAASPSSNRIYVQGVRSVGASGYDDAKYFSARMAPQMVLEAGLGELSSKDLEVYTQTHDIRISADIGDMESAIRGSTTNEALETLLQLTYRYFLRPVRDTLAYRLKMEAMVQHAHVDDYINKALTALAGHQVESHHVSLGLSLDELNKINYDRCLESYEACFSSPQDFVFVVTGVHDLEKTIALVNRYLGSLPARKLNPPPFPVIDAETRSSAVHKTVINNNSKKESAEVLILYSGHHRYSTAETIKQQILVKVVEAACFRRLREREAGIYSLSAGMHTQKTSTQDAQGQHEFRMKFQCHPDIYEKLIAAAQEEVEALKRIGPEGLDFNVAVQAYRKSRLLFNLDDAMWRGQLLELYKKNEDISDLSGMDARIDAVRPEDIQQAAQEYLRSDGFISYTELPKSTKAG